MLSYEVGLSKCAGLIRLESKVPILDDVVFLATNDLETLSILIISTNDAKLERFGLS